MKITIIIPIYNAEKYLEECLNSIISQKYKNLEIILVNDGSTDSSGKICEEFVKKDKRIKVIHQKNLGVSNARNCGIKQASGDWIMFVDADDWINEHCIEKIVPMIDLQSDVIMLNHKYTGNDCQRHIKDDTIFYKGKKIELQKAFFLDNGIRISGTWGKLYKREFLLRENLIYNENIIIGEDLIFNFMAYHLAEKIQYINYIMYNYRRNEESVSNKYNSNMVKEYTKLLLEYIKVLKKYDLEKKFEKEFNYFVISTMNKFLKKYFSNPVNPKSKAELKQELIQIIESEPYKTAIRRISFRRTTFKRKILIILLKLRRIDFILMLYKCLVKE